MIEDKYKALEEKLIDSPMPYFKGFSEINQYNRGLLASELMRNPETKHLQDTTFIKDKKED